MAAPVDHLDLLRRGEAFVLAQIAALDDADFAEPCRLPGWDRAHLIGHVARNADALGNLFSWARTGVEVPMYTSLQQRNEGIETSAAQPPRALRADVEAASARLVTAVDTLPAEGWAAPLRTARGQHITAAGVPWLRVRETWVHAVDMGTGASFADLPDSVVGPLLDEVADGLAGRVDCPPMTLVDDSGSRSWPAGATGSAAAVSVIGPAHALLAWVIGRSGGDGLATRPQGAPLPAPPAWL